MKFDWTEVRRYYEDGHTKRECRERFGFSDGAWDQAVIRGDVEPRSEPDPVRHAHRTRRAVQRRLAAGQPQAQIARELGLSKGAVAYHARRLGLSPDERFARRYDWSQIQSAYDQGLTARECCRRFGCSPASWSQAVARGELVARPRQAPLDEVLVLGTRRRSRFHLKRRLIAEGLKEDRCERCGIAEWLGRPLSTQLHHINGNGLDNRLGNLELLCPNCHALTDNWGGRNKHSGAATVNGNGAQAGRSGRWRGPG